MQSKSRSEFQLKPFRPHRLLLGGRIQTFAGTFLPSHAHRAALSEVIWLNFPDGDRTTIVIDSPDSSNAVSAKQTVVVLFHGLGGHGESPYNLRLSAKLRQNGFTVARYFHRGSGALSKFAKNIYHCGVHQDLHLAISEIQRKLPSHEILTVGFSLSGAALLNLLGRENQSISSDIPQFKAALAICPPLDLETSSVHLSKIDNLLFDRYFSLVLTKQIKQKEKLFPELPRTNVQKWGGLRQLDETYTAKFGGFKNRDDYYKLSSPIRVIEQIRMPTTIVGAADDPIVCSKAFKNDLKNSNITVHLTDQGGHMGYISHHPTAFGDHRWMDELVVDWSLNFHF